MPKEKIQAACSKTKYIREQNKSQYNKENININIIHEQNKTNVKSDENKMEIEPQSSNDLIASNSTKYSNNTSKLSIESSNQISYNTNLIIYPSSQKYPSSSNNEQQNMMNSNNHINNNIINDELIHEKKLFEYNFSSNVEKLSFVGEYLDEIYSNLLTDNI